MLCFHFYWHIKTKTNKYNKIGSDWDIENKLVVATGEAVGGGGQIRWRRFWGANYLLLHDCDCILNQRLWCRAQEIQSIILTLHGVESIKILKPLYCTPETNMTL